MGSERLGAAWAAAANLPIPVGMHAAVALFDTESGGAVERLWRELRDRLGLTGIGLTPVPHLSWDVFLRYRDEALGELLQRRAEGQAPFSVEVHGVGVFPGVDPVLYLAVTKDAALLHTHGSLHLDLGEAVGERSPFYSPERWVPHVTLAHHDADPVGTARGVEYLLGVDLPDRLRVDAYGWIRQSADQVGQLVGRYELGGPPRS